MSTAESSPRRRIDTQVALNRRICREHYLLRLILSDDLGPTRPGQFVQLGCRTGQANLDPAGLQGRSHAWGPLPLKLTQPELCDSLALLRRPFSIAGRGENGDGTNWIDLIHRVVGVGTRWLSRLNQGAAVDLIGPLGNWFDLPPDKSIGLLVGGGVGLPPMFYLAESLRDAGWYAVAFVGATTRDLLAVDFVDGAEPDPQGLPLQSVQQFSRFGTPSVICTDDGTVGLKGLITDGLERTLKMMNAAKRQQTVVFACGPHAMLRAANSLARRMGVACQVCLEQQMACGMGTCQSCAVPIIDPAQPPGPGAWRYRLACHDGPVFDGEDVVW